MRKSLVPAELEVFIGDHLVHQTQIEADLYAESMNLERASMCSSPEVGHVLSFFVKLVGAKKDSRNRSIYRYTSLKMASSLPEDGQLIACDVSDEWTSIGKPFWKQARVDSKIDLRLAPALETMESLENGSFDLIFIDADKDNYPNYFAKAKDLIRTGGLIILDNMLWDGKIADPNENDSETTIIRELGIQILGDPDVNATMLTVGDGLILAQMR